MKYILQQNLGLDDARFCNKELGTSLTTEAKDLAEGVTVDLTESAVKYLTQGKGYTALLLPAGKVTGESKAPEIKAPAK